MQMQELDDNALLRKYVERDSQEAFATLVARHVNKVYSVALRHTRNPSHAEEITQAVFVIFAQKANKLRQHAVLSGWLYETSRLTAVTHIRSEIRRARREQEASMQTKLNEPSPAIWEELSPAIDAAIGKLDRKDHDALVLRFIDGKSMAEVGAILGASEDAAKMRVSRALEKIRKLLVKRGFHCTTSILAQQLSASSICVAPAALIKSATAIAIAKGATASTSTLILIKGTLKIMAWTKAKTAIVVTACLLLTFGTATTTIILIQRQPVQAIPKGWSVLKGSVDEWSWSGGKIHAHSTSFESILASSKTYRDVTLSVVAGTTNREASLAFRLQDADNGYVVIYTPGDTPRTGDAGHIILEKKISGEEIELGAYRGRIFSSLGQSAKIEVSAKGSWILVRLNDVVVLRCKDTTYSGGFIGLRIFGDGDYPCDATFSQLTFY
jgi:RNA polymerase sigma factor (sigma-70 family)